MATNVPDWLRDAVAGSRRKTLKSREARDKPTTSPYYGHPVEHWCDITRQLLAEHPLSGPAIVDAVLHAWDLTLSEPMPGGVYIGRDIFPNAQTMGLLLHSIIPRIIAREHPGWRPERTASDTDLVYEPDVRFNTEIKTSSHKGQVFGNRSYGQPGVGRGKKAKSAFYITVNFDGWGDETSQPEVRIIRFGWLDHTDWLAQASPTGQQSSLPQDVENYQLLTIYKG